MVGDANDGWLDEVLTQRASKSNNDESTSIFKTEALVVKYFLSSTAGADETPTSDSICYPLRRVLCEDIVNLNDNLEQPHWSDQMFTPLFGTPKLFLPSEATIPSITKHIHKKNRKRQRTNLKITVAHRGLDFCGWEDQRHELYRSNDNRRDDKCAKGVRDESNADNNSHILPSVQGTLVGILDLVLGKNESIGPQQLHLHHPPITSKKQSRYLHRKR